jgi:uncharacterized protein HemX
MGSNLCTGGNVNPKHQDSVKFALGHWPILGALAAGLVAWGVNTANMANAQDKVEVLETKVEVLEEKITSIENTTTRIETNQERDQDEQERTQQQLDEIAAMLRNLTIAAAAAPQD